ncbi:hypothetical protein VNI00_013920 [Paramarasmius palmivorus]|uniref:L-tryptophan decarboxylase PsiD-like domain-containing protein n=1 Tax=Paramarasmius palmivorus TaxID=297713 RepID=A0AAW0BWJ8_9AGAR
MSLPKTTLSRYGGWLPSSPIVRQSFFQARLADAKKRLALIRGGSEFTVSADGLDGKAAVGHIPSVADFEHAIKSDERLFRLFNQIFIQAPEENKIYDFDTFLGLLDSILVAPPKFHVATDSDGEVIGEPIGVPLYLIFDLLSNTGAAYDLFRDEKFNEALRTLLITWGNYLSDTSRDSNKSLNCGDEGWFSPPAIEALESNDRGKFEDTYVCPDLTAVSKGFATWDAFFTRAFKPDARPVEEPDNKSLIRSACESTVYRITRNVKEHDKFWLKSQPYSIYDMFKNDEDKKKTYLDDVRYFIGGTIYQAFLSPLDYHRWHAPVDGTVTKTVIIPGTYYAVLPDDGAEKGDPDLKEGDPHGALIRSQAWITMAAARALIFIQADNPDIGLICFIAVGMAEVSTVDVRVQKDRKVKAGDELGRFHFGGSSHTLIFGPQAKITFEECVKRDTHIKLNSAIARARARG